MNLKQLTISILLIITSLSLFFSCDKVEEPYFKPVYTDRNVLSEFIADAQTFDVDLYKEFVNISSKSELIVPMVVLSGDASVAGNSLASNEIVNRFRLNTADSLLMVNRSLYYSIYGVTKDRWQTRLDHELEKKGEFNLEINGRFDYVINQYAGAYSVSSLNGFNQRLSISIYLLEDSLSINSQTVMNVLRSSKENIFLAKQINRSETLEKEFTYDLSSFADLSNLKLLFVLEDLGTKEVLQTKITFIEGLEFSKNKNVLVEDFTGHKCGNCPKAHEELSSLQNTYGARVVPMAIHFGYYAETDSDYPTDFTTPVGDAIGNKFGVTSTPVGMVNRVGDEGNKLLEFSSWDATISNLMTQTPKVGIAIAAQIKAGKIESQVFVKAFEQCDTLLKLQIFVLENHIIDKQVYYDHDPEDIEDYDHEHILRASLNGDWGEDLTAVPFVKDQMIKKRYSYSLNSKWNSNNLVLVAVVYNNETKEIYQVEEFHLQ